MADVMQMLRTYARHYGVRQDIAEKDYALSYLLAAIAETPGLGEALALKGGTALKKLYYADYRFSEDLDYSTLRSDVEPNISAHIAVATRRMETHLLERGPFSVQYEPLALKLPHPGRQAGFLVRVQFPGQRAALCRLKVEITVDEPVLLPIVSLPILHSFDETLTATVVAYTLTEIVVEKLRALLQSHRRLLTRGWGASRVCRDYYDLWAVLRRAGRLEGQIPDLLARKCAVREITFTAPADFLTEDLLTVARQEWAQQLLPFVPGAPPVEQVLQEVRSLILALWE
jgi:predicted nucleotidyltransferase component of viral defense system